MLIAVIYSNDFSDHNYNVLHFHQGQFEEREGEGDGQREGEGGCLGIGG